jgi:hypothetical protein
VQTAGSGGSERLIYVLRAADSHDLVLGKENNGSGFADGPGFLVVDVAERTTVWATFP